MAWLNLNETASRASYGDLGRWSVRFRARHLDCGGGHWRSSRIRKGKVKLRSWRSMILMLFVLYLLAVTAVVSLPASDVKLVTGSPGEIAALLGSTGISRRVAGVCVEFLLNVVLFLPFGFFLRVLSHSQVPVWILVLGGAGASCFIELLQLVVPDRVPSFSDVTANTLGTWAGALRISMLHGVRRRPRTANAE